MQDLIKAVEQTQLRTDLPDVEVGDHVEVSLRITEGSRERIQVFEGTVIARDGKGLSETITVRRVAYGTGVERVLPLHSPKIADIKVTRKGVTRRSKLYYLRDRVGKRARLRESLKTRVAKSDEAKEAAVEAEAEADAETEENTEE